MERLQILSRAIIPTEIDQKIRDDYHADDILCLKPERNSVEILQKLRIKNECYLTPILGTYRYLYSFTTDSFHHNSLPIVSLYILLYTARKVVWRCENKENKRP